MSLAIAKKEEKEARKRAKETRAALESEEVLSEPESDSELEEGVGSSEVVYENVTVA